jgi:hypothetical protein
MTKAQRELLDKAIQDALDGAEVFIEYGGAGLGHVYIRFLEKTEVGMRLYANRRLVFDLAGCEIGKRTQLKDFEYCAANAPRQQNNSAHSASLRLCVKNKTTTK